MSTSGAGRTWALNLTFDEQRLRDLLDNSEQACRYWARIIDVKGDPLSGGRWTYEAWDDSTRYVEDGCRTFVLDRNAVLAGLRHMAIDNSRHFGDWMAENDDGDTADVFLQCCLFGKVVFG